jgi:hypothetical protein
MSCPSRALTELSHANAGDGRFAAGSFDSLSAVELSNAISAALNVTLPGTLIYDYPSVGAMVDHIGTLLGRAQDLPLDIPLPPRDVAVARAGTFKVRRQNLDLFRGVGLERQ